MRTLSTNSAKAETVYSRPAPLVARPCPGRSSASARCPSAPSASRLVRQRSARAPAPCTSTTGVVVLVHGAGARADRWRTSLDALGALGHRALALDLPGHGLATKGAGREYTCLLYTSPSPR